MEDEMKAAVEAATGTTVEPVDLSKVRKKKSTEYMEVEEAEQVLKEVPKGLTPSSRKDIDELITSAHVEVTQELELTQSPKKLGIAYTYLDEDEKAIAYIYSEKSLGYIRTEYYAKSA